MVRHRRLRHRRLGHRSSRHPRPELVEVARRPRSLDGFRCETPQTEARQPSPGRSPFDSLAGMLLPLLGSGTPTGQKHEALLREHQQLARKLREEPGFLGAALRWNTETKAAYMPHSATKLILVDPNEELCLEWEKEFV